MADAFLAGDIGGTKAHLGLYAHDRGKLALVRDQVYRTLDFAGVEAIVAEFLGGGAVSAACFGVPGLVIRGRSHATNLPWVIDEASIARALGGAPTRIVNDLVATAYGMLHLDSSEFAVLQPGTIDPEGFNRAVIAAGTGLGEAALVADRGRFVPIASEGGHASFAPVDDDQIGLLRFLMTEFSHVSFERIVSGPGMFNIYRYLRASSAEPEPPWLTAEINAGDPAAVVTAAALDKRDAVAVRALEIYVDCYGAEAANLALKVRALGGVYLGGGIAPKILPALQDGRFLAAFRAKGRMSDVLARIEVKVSLNPAAALIGASQLAAEMISGAN